MRLEGLDLRRARWPVVALSFWMACVSCGCGPDSPTGAKGASATGGGVGRSSAGNTLSFGFETNDPMEDGRRYGGLLRLLEERTGLRFELVLSDDVVKQLDSLSDGKLDFASLGLASSTRAVRRGLKPVAKGLNADGSAEYRSAFVARPESTLRRLEDLRGHTVVFGREDSSRSWLIPLVMLREAGLKIGDLGNLTHVRGAGTILKMVLEGGYDAGPVSGILARD